MNKLIDNLQSNIFELQKIIETIKHPPIPPGPVIITTYYFVHNENEIEIDEFIDTINLKSLNIKSNDEIYFYLNINIDGVDNKKYFKIISVKELLETNTIDEDDYNILPVNVLIGDVIFNVEMCDTKIITKITIDENILEVYQINEQNYSNMIDIDLDEHILVDKIKQDEYYIVKDDGTETAEIKYFYFDSGNSSLNKFVYDSGHNRISRSLFYISMFYYQFPDTIKSFRFNKLTKLKGSYISCLRTNEEIHYYQFLHNNVNKDRTEHMFSTAVTSRESKIPDNEVKKYSKIYNKFTIVDNNVAYSLVGETETEDINFVLIDMDVFQYYLINTATTNLNENISFQTLDEEYEEKQEKQEKQEYPYYTPDAYSLFALNESCKMIYRYITPIDVDIYDNKDNTIINDKNVEIVKSNIIKNFICEKCDDPYINDNMFFTDIFNFIRGSNEIYGKNIKVGTKDKIFKILAINNEPVIDNNISTLILQTSTPFTLDLDSEGEIVNINSTIFLQLYSKDTEQQHSVKYNDLNNYYYTTLKIMRINGFGNARVYLNDSNNYCIDKFYYIGLHNDKDIFMFEEESLINPEDQTKYQIYEQSLTEEPKNIYIPSKGLSGQQSFVGKYVHILFSIKEHSQKMNNTFNTGATINTTITPMTDDILTKIYPENVRTIFELTGNNLFNLKNE